ncbi:hypothetical protein [Saccharospirillum sp.]
MTHVALIVTCIDQIADRAKVGRLIEDRALRLQRWVDKVSLW